MAEEKKKKFFEDWANGEIGEVDFDKIKPMRPGWSIREKDEDDSELEQSIERSGVLNPVRVSYEDEAVISGDRRYKAAQNAKLKKILVMVVRLPSEDHERYLYLEDNLSSRSFSTAEYIKGVALRKKIHDQLFPHTVVHHAGGQATKTKALAPEKADDKLSPDSMKTFTEKESIRTGKSQRTVQREVQIATALPTVLEAMEKKGKVKGIGAGKAYLISTLPQSLQLAALDKVRSQSVSLLKAKNIINQMDPESDSKITNPVEDPHDGPISIGSWLETFVTELGLCANKVERYVEERLYERNENESIEARLCSASRTLAKNLKTAVHWSTIFTKDERDVLIHDLVKAINLVQSESTEEIGGDDI